MENNVFGAAAQGFSAQVDAAINAQNDIATANESSLAARQAFNERMTEVDAEKSVSDGEANIAQGDLNHIDQMTQAQAR